MSINVMKRMWGRFSGTKLNVMLALGDHSDDGGVAFPSVPKLARKVGTSARQVQRTLRSLERDGHLRVEERTKRSNWRHYAARQYRIDLARLDGDVAGDGVPGPPAASSNVTTEGVSDVAANAVAPTVDVTPPVTSTVNRGDIHGKKPPLHLYLLNCQKEPSSKAPATHDAFFREFWNAYPLKKARLEAERVFKALDVTPVLFQMIMAALKVQSPQLTWTRPDGRHGLHAATWLTGRRWEDQPPNATSTAPAAGALETLLDKTTIDQYNRGVWFSEAELRADELVVPSDDVADWVLRNYLRDLERAYGSRLRVVIRGAEHGGDAVSAVTITNL